MIRKPIRFLRNIIFSSIFFCGLTPFSQFSQNTSLDSILELVKKKIEIKEFSYAQKVIDSLNQDSNQNLELDKIKINYYQSRIFYKKGKHEEALEILLDGFGILQTKYQNSVYYSKYAGKIGVIFSKTKNYEKEQYYYVLQLRNAIERRDSLSISESYLNLGSVYYKNEKIDSAEYYFHKVLDFHPKSIQEKKTLISTYINLIGVSIATENYKLAQDYGNKALEISLASKDTVKVSSALMNLGSIHYQINEFDKAETYYKEAFEILKDRDDEISNRNKRYALLNISATYSARENFEQAYNYLDDYTYLLEVYHDNNIKRKVTEIEAKYNVSEQEKLAEIEKSKKEKAMFWLYILGVSSIILMFFIWLTYRSQKLKREKQELVFQKETLLQERKIEIVKNEAQIKILNATIDGKELERNHIAGILHDSVSALLSSAGLHLQAAKIELDGSGPEEIEKTQAIVKEAGEKIRDLSHKLISSVLVKFGLSYAIDEMCEKYSNSKLTFQSDSKDIQRYNREFEIKIHSIIEELINNIIKHSDAEQAHILLKQFDGQLQIRIFDDGKGFDVEKMRENSIGGLGLTQIEARIKVMKGIFNINSSKETGTRIFINVPISDELLN